MLATRQPPNLRKMLTKAKFDLIPEIKYQPPPGLYPCQNCTYCRRGYIKNMDSFSVVGENGYVSTWKFTHHFSCDSENVLYVCKILVDENFYLGRTVNVKNRTAKHISDVLNPANSKCKEFTEYMPGEAQTWWNHSSSLYHLTTSRTNIFVTLWKNGS